MKTFVLGENYDKRHQNQVVLTAYRDGEARGALPDAVYPTALDSTHSSFDLFENPINNHGQLDQSYRDCSGNEGRQSKNTLPFSTSSSFCSRKTLLKRIPILSWSQNYNCTSALADLVAGVSVGLTVIPQGIAYANIAGLEPQYGLYSSFMASFVYALFGSCKDSPIGPTAIAALLSRKSIVKMGPDATILLCFLSGIIELLMGLFKFGFLIDFISGPVSVGFTSAAAFIIATSQVKNLLGLHLVAENFIDTWTEIFQRIHETRIWDACLGFSCIFILLFLKKIKDLATRKINGTNCIKTVIKNTIWFISISRNILIVVISSGLVLYFDETGFQPFILTDYVKPGLPTFIPPPFSTTVNNRTYNFQEMTSELGSSILIIPLLSVLENISLAKVFSEGKPIDATQEMLALGVCNIASSFVQSMPVTGALSRGAVNHASGVKTPWAGVYSGIIVLVSLQFLTPLFVLIPRAALGAVIVTAVVFMVELHVLAAMWHSKKSDILPAVITFTTCLLVSLELGIAVGIAVNIAFILYASARPRIRIENTLSNSKHEYILIIPDRSLRFPAAQFLRKSIEKASINTYLPVVFDARHVCATDFTAAQSIKEMMDNFDQKNRLIIFYNLKKSLLSVIEGVKPSNLIIVNTEEDLDEVLENYECIKNNINRF